MLAQLAVAKAYEQGHGVDKDLQQAFQWYGKAAARNCEEAIAALGHCYLEGRGTRQNGSLAFSTFSGLKDTSLGWYGLGLCHERGLGTPKNLARAIVYYRKASEFHYPVERKPRQLLSGWVSRIRYCQF